MIRLNNRRVSLIITRDYQRYFHYSKKLKENKFCSLLDLKEKSFGSGLCVINIKLIIFFRGFSFISRFAINSPLTKDPPCIRMRSQLHESLQRAHTLRNKIRLATREPKLKVLSLFSPPSLCHSCIQTRKCNPTRSWSQQNPDNEINYLWMRVKRLIQRQRWRQSAAHNRVLIRFWFDSA